MQSQLFHNSCIDQAGLRRQDNSSDSGVLGLKAGHQAQLTHNVVMQTLGTQRVW